MGKKKKTLKLNSGIVADSPNYVDVDKFNLPKTLANVPEAIRTQNNMAFDSIRPQLEGFLSDGWQHTMKAMGILHCADASFMGYGALANLSQNGLIRAGVEMRGDEMTRKWGELTRKGNTEKETDEQQEKLDDITEEMEKYKVRELFRSASCLCGYMGGCLLFIDTGEEVLANPLILDSMTFAPGTFKGFRLIEPYLVTPGGYNSTNPMADDYFKPSLWYIQGIPVHASRLIYFTENKLTSLLKPAYNFFGLPLAQKVIDAVAHYTENREAAGRLLQKYALTVLKTTSLLLRIPTARKSYITKGNSYGFPCDFHVKAA